MSFIEKLLKQQRETGSIAPKVRTQQTPTKLKPEQLNGSVDARSYPDLAQAIEDAFDKLSLEDIHNWFYHCCYCTSVD